MCVCVQQNVCAHVFDSPRGARQGYGYYDRKEACSNSPGDGYRVLRLSPISPEPSHPPVPRRHRPTAT